STDPEQLGDPTHRRPLRLMLGPDLADHPDRPLTQLSRVPRTPRHDSNPSKEWSLRTRRGGSPDRVGKIVPRRPRRFLRSVQTARSRRGVLAQFAGLHRCLVVAPRRRDGKPSGIDQQTRIVATLVWVTPAIPGDTVRGRGRLG